jgi:hypothetical protein
MKSMYSGPQVDRNGQACIHLQGIGLFAAKPAGELKVGDTMVWNYGSTSVVHAIRAQGKSVYITQQTKDGKVWPERRFLATRLVASPTPKSGV